MAIAKFHSFRGEKSALILVKANAFVFNAAPCYVPKESIPANCKEGDSFNIPDGFTLVSMPELDKDNNPVVDPDTGAIKMRCASNGEELKVLAY